MKTDIYRTTDLGEAAALITSGYEMITMEMENPIKHQLAFCFYNSPKLIDCVRKYYLHELRIDPNEFYYRSKDLRLHVRNTGRNLIPAKEK